jgi:hypothetical protein
MLRNIHYACTTLAMLALAGTTVFAADGVEALAKQGAGRDPLFLTATNATNNSLVIINTRTKQTAYVPTGGAGGVSGNAGGVAVSGKLAAVINFGSSNVTIFERVGNTMQAIQMVKTTSQPLSVAFGHDHLLVLGQADAESFPVYGTTVGANDGIVQLLRSDKSGGQIVSYDGGAAYSMTSGAIGLLTIETTGAPGFSGTSTPVILPPAPNNDTPLGMVARGANVYATIAHSDLEVLIVNSQIISTAVGPTPFKNDAGGLTHAPCWNALSGQFLFASDSPGKQLLRYLVSDTNIFFDKPAVATLAGAPTDLDIQNGMLGVIDGGSGGTGNASVFDISSEGELSLRFSVKITGAINGAAIIQ